MSPTSSSNDSKPPKPRTPFLDSKLGALGFKSYDNYLSSRLWQDTRCRYWEDPSTPKECLCGETKGLALHHLTYRRLGRERLSDLRALCRSCHTDIHVLSRQGLIKLDLDGYTSEERAAQYAQEREARDEAAAAKTTDADRARELERLRDEVHIALKEWRARRADIYNHQRRIERSAREAQIGHVHPAPSAQVHPTPATPSPMQSNGIVTFRDRALERLRENVRQGALRGSAEDQRELLRIVNAVTVGDLAIRDAHDQVTAIRNRHQHSRAA